MPSTPPPTTSPNRSAVPLPGGRVSARAVLAARLGVAVAAAAGMAGLTVVTAGASGPAGAAGRPYPARGSSSGVHMEAVSAPVLVTAAEMEQAEHVQAATVHVVSASSSSGDTGTDLGTFLVTCYDIHGRTASGEEAGPQSVAVDPSVIPLGSEIYIDGVGYRRADDTGGGVRGHHIDIWESSYSACTAFGRQYRDVHRAS